MTSETYNGWANRETWAMALWINNDQVWQESVHDVVRHAVKDAQERRTEGDLPAWNDRLAASYAGDAVRDQVEGWLLDLVDMAPRSAFDIAQDIGSMWRVDWTEIGATFAQDVTEQDQ